MSSTRRQHRPEFKFKVALEASKGTKTVAQVASEFNVHPNQVSTWKKQLLAEGKRVFAPNRSSQQAQEKREAKLYEQIGRLQMELDWLGKKSASFR